MHLHLLELTDVVLANGGIVQVPQFVADACARILEHVDTEGIFRKAGSSLRQKEIKVSRKFIWKPVFSWKYIYSDQG